MTNGNSPSGWYQDPTGQGDSRYWNGTGWTESVNRGGAVVDVPVDPSQAQIPPAPGTQVAPPAQPAASQPAPTVTVADSSGSSIFGIIVGGLALVLVIGLIIAFVTNEENDDTPATDTDISVDLEETDIGDGNIGESDESGESGEGG